MGGRGMTEKSNYYQKLNAITEYELAQLKEEYRRLSEGVERSAIVIANCQRYIALKTYVDDLKANGITMAIEYQDNQLPYDMLIELMLKACIETWQEHLEDE
jgi:hypothetical protein